MWPQKRKILTSKIAPRINNNHSLYTCKIKNCVTCVENFILNLSGHKLTVLLTNTLDTL